MTTATRRTEQGMAAALRRIAQGAKTQVWGPAVPLTMVEVQEIAREALGYPTAASMADDCNEAMGPGGSPLMTPTPESKAFEMALRPNGYGAQGYEAWMRKVDAAVWAKAQMSVHDLPDCPTRDWFEDGMTPKAAASKAIRMAEGEDE